jgi:hypothetical protein
VRPKEWYIPPDEQGAWIVYECGHVRKLTLLEVADLGQNHQNFRQYLDCPQCEEVTDEEFWSAARRSGTGPELGPDTYYHQQIKKLLQMDLGGHSAKEQKAEIPTQASLEALKAGEKRRT